MPIRRSSIAHSKVAMQTKGGFNCRHMRQKLIHAVGQKCSYQEVCNWSFKKRGTTCFLDNSPSLTIDPLHEFRFCFVTHLQFDGTHNFVRSAVPVVIDSLFPAKAIG